MEKKEIIEEIKALIGSEEESVDINPKYLDYFSYEELEDIKNKLLFKKQHYHQHTKEFVDELYEKTKKVGI
jgi:hypothetical protein